MRILLVGISLLAVTTPQAALERRPTDVTVVMSTSRKKYDGTYTVSLPSRACGQVTQAMIDAFQRMSRTFLVEFPVQDGKASEITDLTFYAPGLIGGVTSTTKFNLSISLNSKQIGSPGAYILDTDRRNATGTATLTSKGGTDTLKVTGVNDQGQTVDLTVVCKPSAAK